MRSFTVSGRRGGQGWLTHWCFVLGLNQGQSEQQNSPPQRFEMGECLMKTHALFDLTGRVGVVTGGKGGIGRGIALGLAEAGAAVAVLGRNDEKSRRVLSELKAIGVPSIAVKVDVTDRSGLEPALNRVERELGPLSLPVNNAVTVALDRCVVPQNTGHSDSRI